MFNLCVLFSIFFCDQVRILEQKALAKIRSKLRYFLPIHEGKLDQSSDSQGGSGGGGGGDFQRACLRCFANVFFLYVIHSSFYSF